MEGKINGNGAFGPPASLGCKKCGLQVNTKEPHRKLRKMLIEGRVSENDPIIGYIHEACQLRVELTAKEEQNTQLATLFAATLNRFGGSIRLHQNDIKAIEDRMTFSINATPDGFITVDIPRIIIAPPGGVPPLNTDS